MLKSNNPFDEKNAYGRKTKEHHRPNFSLEYCGFRYNFVVKFGFKIFYNIYVCEFTKFTKCMFFNLQNWFVINYSSGVYLMFHQEYTVL